MGKLFRLNKLIVTGYHHLCTKLVMKYGYFADTSKVLGLPQNWILRDYVDFKLLKKSLVMHINWTCPP